MVSESARPASEREIGDQLVDEVWNRARSSALAYVAVLLVAWPIVREPAAGSRGVLAAYSASLTLGVVRWLGAIAIAPRLARLSFALRHRLMLASAAANGLALCALGVLLVPRLGPLALGVYMVVVAGIAGGAAISFGPRPEVFAVYAVPMIGGVMFAALFLPGEGRNVIVPALGIWLLFSVAQVVQYRRMRRQLIALNLELDASVRALHQKKEDVERTNRELVAMTQRADRIFSALADALPGRTLAGRYKLESRIGDGGFSIVFRGVHTDLDRPVAVKIFRPQAGNDSAIALERFRQEGMASTRVRHPNVVEVFDAGVSDDGIPFIVMELLNGHPLGAELTEGEPLPLARIAQVMIQACRGLAAAHAAGVIHRDVKPDNIFVHRDQQTEGVKVLDFGIAKVLDATRASSTLTSSGAFLGTPHYMAPERFLGKECDAGADVYSVGVIIYASLAGRLPFGGTVGEIMMQAVSTRPRSLRELAPDVPEAVVDVVMRALDDDPSKRPSAAEVADTLARASPRAGRDGENAA